MARRTRSAKFLGTRHDREYFRSWTNSRKWRVGLTLLLPIVGCVWLLAHTIRGSSEPYSSGPLSPSHNVFGNNCEACHVNGKNLFGRVSFQKRVADNACLDCHNSPQHQAGETFTPQCATCHTEHVGSTSLISVTDKQCVQCHRDLHVKSGSAKVETVVKSFAGDHPEFRPLRKPHDPGTVALNHLVHMRAGIRGPQGSVQMQCQDCHRPAADGGQPWMYSLGGAPAPKTEMPLVQMVATALDPLPPSTGRAHMTPIKYETQCAACHELQFDERIADLVPHGKPEIIHDFMVAKYRAYLTAHPNVWRETPRPVRRIPGVQPPPPAHSAEEWVTTRTVQAEMVLWRKDCKLCHTIDNVAGSALPKIRPANITVRWLPHSTFNHYAHQAVACDSCHSRARTSKETSDVLVPGIDTCRKCHHDEPTQIGAAGDGCSLCHQYHDWTKQPPGLKGKFTIEQLLTKKATPQTAAGQ